MARLSVLLACALALAACGHAASVTSQDNAQVCRNYLQQRAWVKGLVQPDLADVVQFEADVEADWGNTAPGSQLSKDLGAMWADMIDHRSDYAASVRVYDDCT